MKELWKPIKNYEGLYEVSNYGNIKTVKTNRLMKLRLSKDGYLRVNLSKQGVKSTALVHKLVAQEFVPNPNSKPTVDHIDRVKTNNVVSNLRWATLSEQVENKTHGEKRIYCNETHTVYTSLTQASNVLSIPTYGISKVLNGSIKHTGGYTFEYR